MGSERAYGAVMWLLGAAMCAAVGGCSIIVSDGGTKLPSAPTTLTVSPESVRKGDSVTATADGSIDPLGMTLQYRFEWLLGTEVVRTQVTDGSDTLVTELNKAESWTVRATPVTADEREGLSAETLFDVQNTPPLLQTVALSSYAPIVTDTVRATPDGPSDVDGDAVTYRYVWQIGSRAPLETTQGSLDLGELSPVVSASETLSLEVFPTDGEDENPDGTVSLGPFNLLADATQWRRAHPAAFSNGRLYGDFAVHDARHRRFVFAVTNDARVQSHWEYSPTTGWAELPSPGPSAELFIPLSLFDATPDQERVLFFGFNDSEEFEIHALDVTSRGREAWTQLPTPSGGPDALCAPSAYFDIESRILMLYGGLDAQCGSAPTQATNRIWLLDLSNEASPTWVDAPDKPWFEGLSPTAGARVVRHPTLEKNLLFFGGASDKDLSVPSPIQRLSFDFDDLTDVDLSFFSGGSPLQGDPIGVFAIADLDAGTVIGGLGSEVPGPGLSDPVNSTWVYDAATQQLRYRNSPVFTEYDTELGSAFGTAGWFDDRVLLVPGVSLTNFASSFGVIEIEPAASEYDWRSLVRPDGFPAEPDSATFDQGDAFVTGGSLTGAGFFGFDRELQTWRYLTEESGAPTARRNVYGGATPGLSGLWTFGGFDPDAELLVDMTPRLFRDQVWSASSVSTPLPPRMDHQVFDTGCGDAVPVGFVGGEEGDESGAEDTWLLDCSAPSTDCDWVQVDLSDTSAWLQVTAAYDGIKYVVAIGNRDGSGAQVRVLDACAATPSWVVASDAPDPTDGGPDSAEVFAAGLIVGSSPPELMVFERCSSANPFGNGVCTWVLRETADKAYQWDKLNLAAVPDIGFPFEGAAALDPGAEGVLLFTGNGEAWELHRDEGGS